MTDSRILVGNCLERLKELADDSVDSIVTDPPYELGFMGKKWDASGIAYNINLWAECLRVLKPGGHLLAFGGTRTYHRMAVAIEDAGFEIRDSIHWIYGSGFPKSLDISKAIDKMDAKDEQQERRYRFTAWVRSTGLTSKQIDDATGTNMGGHYTTTASQPAIMTTEHLDAVRHLIAEVPDWVEREAQIRSVESKNFASREVIGNDGRSANESWFGTAVRGETGFGIGEWDITAPATDAAKQWAGWGTALKPAHEPIVVARKPLVETVASNVLRFGVGGLNIDGTRVAGDYLTRDRNTDGGNSIFGTGAGGGAFVPTSGRWPANVIFTHNHNCQQIGTRPDSYQINRLEEWSGFGQKERPDYEGSKQKTTVAVWECTAGCPVAELDQQSGISKSQGGRIGKKEHGTIAIGGAGTFSKGDPGFGDIGGASRFFTVTEWADIDVPFRYVAKPGKRERNAGVPDGTIGHPTVKPVALMRWLIRLITPPEGTVLDPFLGSGTTAVAATLEGFNWIGCELTDDYLPIIEGRVAWAEIQTLQPEQLTLEDN